MHLLIMVLHNSNSLKTDNTYSIAVPKTINNAPWITFLQRSLLLSHDFDRAPHLPQHRQQQKQNPHNGRNTVSTTIIRRTVTKPQ